MIGFRRTLLVTCTAALAAACVSGGNPRIRTDFDGKPSADFFNKYGPPDQVIAYQAIPKGADPLNYPQGDPKELVYYWSSINKTTMTSKKHPEPLTQECNLAILTEADGKILRVEVQTDSGDIQSARTYCESVLNQSTG
ncbi:hypothetical protein GCM10009077_33440 [Roseibium denhamense]|uniref:Lipoprotein n=2 Tax=Roseibium denhamense TaxID=76305 RepID=A0ABY1NYG9_9HYPH|nr:hypothetical protein SAMN06265374_2106 [Roseibium denhamense]